MRLITQCGRRYLYKATGGWEPSPGCDRKHWHCVRITVITHRTGYHWPWKQSSQLTLQSSDRWGCWCDDEFHHGTWATKFPWKIYRNFEKVVEEMLKVSANIPNWVTAEKNANLEVACKKLRKTVWAANCISASKKGKLRIRQVSELHRYGV